MRGQLSNVLHPWTMYDMTVEQLMDDLSYRFDVKHIHLGEDIGCQHQLTPGFCEDLLYLAADGGIPGIDDW